MQALHYIFGLKFVTSYDGVLKRVINFVSSALFTLRVTAYLLSKGVQ